jgi:peptidoglycan/xylan/chitin deacetylase (PgdA/CDA1 family)
MVSRRDMGVALAVSAVAATTFVAGMGLVAWQDAGEPPGERTQGRAYAPPLLHATVTPGAHARRSGVTFSEPTRVPVLCYHYLRGKSDPLRLLRVFGYVVLSLPLLNDTDVWTTSASEFERQLEYLKARGYQTVTLDELHEWQMGWRVLPAKPVVLTFDDGDESVYDVAFPILERLRFRATLFVVTARVGTRWNDVSCLDWARLREMEASGVFQIESHTHDLHYKVDVDGTMRPVFVAAGVHGFDIEGAHWEDAVRDDLVRSREAIARHLGRAPAFLAWPYGTATPELDRVAIEAGFARTCTLRAGANDRAGARSVEIARYTITARTSLRTFRTMLEGSYRPQA